MIITSQIDMDFQQQKAPQEIKAVQYDANTRQVAISCYDNGEPVDLSEVSRGVVHSRNADGTVSLYDTTQAGEHAVSIAGNVATVILDPSICAAPGKASVVVTLLNEQQDQLGIFPFAVQVSPCPVDYGETESSNYFNLLNQTIADLYDGVQDLVNRNAAQIEQLQTLGGITDVTLAGTSIVSNLVATIPEATSETDGFMTAEQVNALNLNIDAIASLNDRMETAESDLSTAQSTADSAVSAASAAQNTADSAQSTANSAVQDSGWKRLTFSNGFSDSWPADIQSQYRKIGKLVYLHVCAKGATGTWMELATLPEGYRPHQSIDVVGRYDSHQHSNINIANTGVVAFISTDGTADASKVISFTAAYFVE